MPQTYAVRLYQSTGFDKANLPDSPALLETCTYVDTDAAWLFQNRGNASIRVNEDWESIKNTDYLRLGTTDPTYYVVTGVVMLSAKTAQMQLLRDPFLSAGGLDAITVIGGWTKRAHTADDSLFGNIISEPWAPSNHLQIRQQTTIHGVDENAGTLEIAIATSDIERADEFEAKIAKTAGSAGTGLIESVVWPELPAMDADGTVVTTPGDGGGSYDYQLPGMYAFNLSAAPVREGINAVRSLGIESSILNMYVIPSIDCVATWAGGEHPNFATTLAGQSHVYTPNQPYEYASVKNRKAIALYNYYMLESVASGASQSFEAKELYSGGTAPDWETKSDPSPSGTVYCQPTYYEGTQTVMWSHAVASSPWYNAGYVYDGASGETVINANLQRSNNRLETTRDYNNAAYTRNTVRNVVNTAGGLLNTAVGTVGTILDPLKSAASKATGLAGGVVSGMQGLLNGVITQQDLNAENHQMNTMTDMSIGDNIWSAMQQTAIVAPTLSFPVTVTAASYFGHAFRITQITLSDNDVARFDRYLTMYGYAQDKPFEHDDLTNRQKFNYIVVQGAEVAVPGNNMQLLNEITEGLAGGVRFWHIKPAQSAYADNPIAEG